SFDAGGCIDLQFVLCSRLRAESEKTHALVGAWLLIIVEGMHVRNHDLAALIDDPALQLGRLVQHRACLEINPVRYAVYQVAALREELYLQLLDDNGYGPDQRFRQIVI